MEKSHEKKNFFLWRFSKMWPKSEFRKDGMDTEKMMGFDEEYLRSTSNKILLQQC